MFGKKQSYAFIGDIKNTTIAINFNILSEPKYDDKMNTINIENANTSITLIDIKSSPMTIENIRKNYDSFFKTNAPLGDDKILNISTKNQSPAVQLLTKDKFEELKPKGIDLTIPFM